MSSNIKRYITVFLTLFIFFISGVLSSADSVFQVTDDAYTSSASANQNYGGQSRLYISSKSVDVKNTYIKVDFSGFLNNEAKSARLYFYNENTISPAVVTVSECDNNEWSEETIKWDNQPAAKNPVRFVNIEQAGWYSIDVTNCVNRRMAEKTVTFLLELEPDTNEDIYLSSSEAVTNQPYMEIASGQPPKAGALNIPFRKLQAEEAETNGKIRYSVDQPDIAYEASGRAFAELSEKGEYIEFKSNMQANKITVRYNIPLSSAGSISIYKNNVFRSEITLTSDRIWLYKEAMPNERFTFWDEVILSENISENDLIRVQIDKEEHTGQYGIDFLELEMAPEPLQKPDDSWISITDAPYNANGEDKSDDLQAIQKCINDSVSLTKKVWIPKGNFICTDQISVPTGVEIRGAGIWHTILNASQPDTGQNRSFLLNGKNVLKDFKLTHPYNARGRNGGIRLGSNCTVDGVWLEYSMGAGIFGYSIENTTVKNCRIRSTFADGIHFARNSKNCVMENNTIRNAGDDSLALISYEDEGLKNNICINNTIECAPWGRGIAVAGGNYNTIEMNHIEDTSHREGILVTIEEYSGLRNPFCKNFLVQDNMLIRCGRKDYKNFGAMWICANYDLPMWGNIQYNSIKEPVKNGISASKYITSLVKIHSNIIESPAFEGDYIGVYSNAQPEIAGNSLLAERTNRIYGEIPTIRGLNLWLRADQGINMDSNQKVSSWADQSGNKISLKQSTGSKKPEYVRNELNGYPAIKFSGSYLGAALDTAYTGGYSIYMVMKMPDANITGATFFSTLNPSGTALIPGQFFIQQPSDKALKLSFKYAVNDEGNQNHPLADLDERWSGYGIFNLELPGSRSIKAFVNEYETYSSNDSKLASARTFNYYGIGARNNVSDSSHFADCEIAEILVYHTAQTEAERNQVHKYLKNRYFDWYTTKQLQFSFLDNDGKYVSSPTEGGCATSDITVKLNLTHSRSITMVSALYDKTQGNLLAMSFDTKDISGGEEASLTCVIDELPENVSNCVIKNFFINSLNKIKPVLAPVIYEP